MSGQHRRRGHPDPPGEIRVLTEPDGCVMTVDDLRRFLADVDRAAARTGTNPGHLRLGAAVRFSGAVKGVWIRDSG